jgi:adenine-specific DNA-methyltransferase
MINLMQGDCLELMKDIPDGSVDLTVTSPPYNIGKEYESSVSMGDYIGWQREVITEAARLTRLGGSVCWQVGNYVEGGAVYPLDCLLFSIFLEAGLIPRNRIVWTFGHGLHCKNRYSGRHETVLWFSKGDAEFNLDPVRVPQKYPAKRHYKGPKTGQLSGNPLGKNPGDVWDIPNVKHNHPEKTAHPCQFPEALIDRLLLSVTRPGGITMDPFMGSGTVGACAARLGRNFIGIEQDAGYFEIARKRIAGAISP